MKKTLSMLAIVVSLPFIAGSSVPQTDEQGRGQARGGQSGSRQPEHARPRPPKPPDSSHAQPRQPSAPPHAQQRPPDRPRGTTGVLPPAHPRPPFGAPRYRVYPEPRVYDYVHPRVAVPIIVYPHPHFWFSPWLWLGFGIYIGYPVPYPLYYGAPTYAYGDGMVQAAPVAYGGIAFTVIPDEASVIVDGAFVGTVRDFGPTRQPLTLTPGRHHVELEVPGMVPLAFDVDIVAGQVIPYSGRLQPE